MWKILQRIFESDLATAKFCRVFEPNLKQVWPIDNAEHENRAALTQDYVQRHG